MQDKWLYEPSYLRARMAKRIAAKVPAIDVEVIDETHEPVVAFEPFHDAEYVERMAYHAEVIANFQHDVCEIIRAKYAWLDDEHLWLDGDGNDDEHPTVPTSAVFGTTLEIFDADEFTVNAGFTITTHPWSNSVRV